MQAAYALCRDATRMYQHLRPNTVNVADLCSNVPDGPNEDIRYHVLVLEAEALVETRNLRFPATGSTLEVLQFVRLSHSLAANRFLEEPDGQANWRREARSGPQWSGFRPTSRRCTKAVSITATAGTGSTDWPVST